MKPMINRRVRHLNWVLSVVLVLLTGAGSAWLMTFDTGPAAHPVEAPVIPKVMVIQVAYETAPLSIRLNGTVSPLYRTKISCEVAGKVAYVSDKLVRGGYFTAGELMLGIEDGDYVNALAESRHALANAALNAKKEEELARQAVRDWQDLGRGTPTDLVLRRPNLAAARAGLAAAKSALEQAERKLGKTGVRAPFDCMVSAVSVSKGTVVSQGMEVMEIFGVGTAEIRLPLSPEDARFVDLPRPGIFENPGQPAAVLWRENGRQKTRQGTVVRTEGTVDAETRFQYLVVRVDDPYGFTRKAPALKIGSFVTVRIAGKKLDRTVRLPASALGASLRVMRVDDGARLSFVPVDLLRRMGGDVLVRGAFARGQRIVVSPLDYAVEGMRVDIDEAVSMKEGKCISGTQG